MLTAGQLKARLRRQTGIEVGFPFCNRMVCTAERWDIDLIPMIEQVPEGADPGAYLNAMLLNRVERVKDTKRWAAETAARERAERLRGMA